MAIDRREFLFASSAFATLAMSPALARADPASLYAAARRGSDGRYSAAIFSPEGNDVNSVALPARGHDIAVCPVTRRCVVFARRPGNFATAFRADKSEMPLTFEAPADRHFYGHGVFSHDGRLLYTTENDFEAGRGVIGIYDATDGFRRIGEFASHGIGPHDMALLGQGRVLVVANGGLKEHPDFGGGRRVLNLEAIETSLAYIDIATGDLLEQHAIPAGGALSLRHLEVARDDTVVLGGQIVSGAPGAEGRTQSLIYRHRRQKPLTATVLPDEAAAALSGYVSSVSVDRDGLIAAATSSKAGGVVIFEIATGQILTIKSLEDVSGVASGKSAGDFLVTSGMGTIANLTPVSGPAELTATSNWNWDNHTVRIGR
ncbi:MAG: hypothetical protein BGN89_19745 [Alphaproteobacteria bacterium 64-6]|nr:DUF1513 domain-containing protein [Hyphomicrobium sp.]OJU27073.1 MAG: hypothetical protein BGN89_19745 [Alphaproteobacteria bacterium 64-6]